MNGSSYFFFLTKSRSAADLISAGLSAERDREGYLSIGSGALHEDSRIPSIYHNCGYHYAFAEYKSDGSPKYELIIC